MKKRMYNLLTAIFIIILGLLSRKLSFIPLVAGDILWSIMIFYLVSFVFVDWDFKKTALVSLIICYLVEFSQLLQVAILVSIRSNRFGRLILGQGFLWTDILAYTLGLGFVTLFEYRWKNRN